MTDTNLILTSCTLILCVIIFIRSILLRKKVCLHRSLCDEQTRELEKLKDTLEQQKSSQSREASFDADLKQAEVTTELQKTRSSVLDNRHNRRPPERYRYALSMFQSGIKKEEIATALRMSVNEISQLLKLADLSCSGDSGIS